MNKLLGRAAIGFALWTIFGVLWATPELLGPGGAVDGNGLWDAAGHVVVFYWAWAIVTPLVLRIARRTAQLSSNRIHAAAFVTVLAPVVILAQGILYFTLIMLLRIRPASGFDQLGAHFLRHGGGDLATYLTLIGVYLLVDTNRRAREGERAAAELLRWQLQPHFLFNALNTVSTLVLKEELDDANRAIELIARYLRDALTQRSDSLVPLETELATVSRYVEIERLRFGDALCVQIDASAEARQATLPNALLQPLVENAIRHGVPPSAGRAAIAIAATVSNRRLQVRVADPGRAEPTSGALVQSDAGFGLQYVKERLRQHYGARAAFTLTGSANGTVAELDVPVTPR